MNRVWAEVVGAVVLVAVAFAVGYVVSDDGHGASDDHGFGNDRMAVMMADGSMQTMMDDFTGMMTQLRRSMTPEMRRQMDRDEMLQLMESAEMQEMVEQH